uniref:Transcription initiation factor IID subunit A family protein n=1 Tax=Rhizophora mucronata TaxID=61149 RepID=A0A2P2KQF7_RHIMU
MPLNSGVAEKMKSTAAVRGLVIAVDVEDAMKVRQDQTILVFALTTAAVTKCLAS